jgi:hypothetical protein
MTLKKSKRKFKHHLVGATQNKQSKDVQKVSPHFLLWGVLTRPRLSVGVSTTQIYSTKVRHGSKFVNTNIKSLYKMYNNHIYRT